MTLRGALVDLRQRAETRIELEQIRKALAHNLTRVVEEGIGFAPFNYRSPPQLKKLFYEIMGFKPIKARNSNGVWAPSTGRKSLEKLSQYWSAKFLCKHILALRDLDKKLQFINTEIDADNRMRTSYNIAGTNTGRLSSSASDFGTGTNQQNIEKKLRRMFIPDPGMKFCNIDLEQADARNVGAICYQTFVETHGESYAGAYLDACESGDLHTTVCRMAWTSLPWGEDASGFRTVADQIAYRMFTYRDLSKKLGHGTNFYGTPRTMALHTQMETSIISGFQKNYFGAFPVIGSADRNKEAANWHNNVRYQLIEFGSLTTPFFNRRRFFYGRPDDDKTLREAIAYCPQSMTADEIDTAIIRLEEWGKVQLLIQVHDSILFQYPEEREEEIIPEALNLMKVIMPLKRGREFFVPLEAKMGWNWDEVSDENPFGLAYWKGPGEDRRERPELKQNPTAFQELLNARS